MDDRETRALRRALLTTERPRGSVDPAPEIQRDVAARDLGGAAVRYETVRRWAELAPAAATGLVPVRLRLGAESTDELVLVSPRGYRVERLSSQQVAAILRELE